MSGQCQYWLDALDGKFGDLPRGALAWGYYRNRNDAVAIWQEGERWIVVVNDETRERRGAEDELAERIFCTCSRSPITEDVYRARVATGEWPESVKGDVAAAREPVAADRSQHEIILAEIDATQKAFDKWFATLPNGVESEAHDAKVASFVDAMGELGKKAEAAHKAEKAPHLKAGREVDDRWRVAKERPGCLKAVIARAAEPYRIERERKRRAEADRQRQEHAKVAAEARARSEPVPIPMSAPKPRTGLRTYTATIIEDRRAFAAWLGARNEWPSYLDDALTRYAGEMLKAGPVPGAKSETRQKAA